MNILSFIMENLFPFAVMILAAAFIYLSVSCLIEIKKDWWHRGLLFAGCWLIISMVIFIGDLVNLPPTMFFFLFCVWISCKGSGLKRITIGLMIASTIFAFDGLHDNCILYFIQDYFESVGPQLRTLFALLLYLGIRSHRPEQDFELSSSLWRLLLALTMPPLGIVLALILFRSPYSSYAANVLADTVLFSVAILSFAGLLWAVKVLDRHQKLERESVLAEHNKKYYEAMEQQQFEIRRLKHDLANHLQVLTALPEEEKNNYIKEMLDNPVFTKVLAYSGDATVNAVLTSKESRMRQENIDFYARMDIPGELPFEKADICALFANALDNAIEGCRDLDKELRKIELTARAGKGLLAVCVKNPYAGKREEKPDKLLKTTKADAVSHGFGLRSIREAVKKYGGNMEIRQEDKRFILFLYLPMSCEDKEEIRC